MNKLFFLGWTSIFFQLISFILQHKVSNFFYVFNILFALIGIICFTIIICQRLEKE